MGKILRNRIAAELAQKYRDTRNCVFVDFTGLDNESMSNLRLQIRKSGAEFFVVKNSLLRRAMEDVGLPTADDIFARPTAVVTGGEDPVAIYKLIVAWQKKSKTSEIKGGLLERKLLTQREVVELSSLPSRPVLLSQVLGVFIAPLSDIASLLNNTVGQIANLFRNHIEKMEEAG